MTEPVSLPWATEPDDREGMEWNVHIVEAARPHMRIAFMSNGPDSEVHAEYLVKACNAFPDLVKALEDVIKNNQITVWRTIEVDAAGNTMESTEVDGTLATIARRALAAVKGRSNPDE